MATLADLDELYKTTISNLPTETRQTYCINHLDKIQAVLTTNISTLDRQQKEKLKEIIVATQQELHELETLETLDTKRKHST